MKKFLLVLGVVVMIFGVTGAAGAGTITITDTAEFPADYVDHGWGDIMKLDGFGDYLKWTHHFSFDPPASEILSGTLTIGLQDDERDRWWNPLTWEIGVGYSEDGTWDIGTVDTGDYVYDVNIAYLADGEFSISLASLWGDFSFISSEIEITYAPVPEPATMLLVSSGLIGLAGLRRRKFSKS